MIYWKLIATILPTPHILLILHHLSVSAFCFPLLPFIFNHPPSLLTCHSRLIHPLPLPLPFSPFTINLASSALLHQPLLSPSLVPFIIPFFAPNPSPLHPFAPAITPPLLNPPFLPGICGVVLVVSGGAERNGNRVVMGPAAAAAALCVGREKGVGAGQVRDFGVG